MQIQTFDDACRVVISGFDPVLFQKLKIPDHYTVIIDPPVADTSVFEGLARKFQNVPVTTYTRHAPPGTTTIVSAPQTKWVQTLLPIP